MREPSAQARPRPPAATCPPRHTPGRSRTRAPATSSVLGPRARSRSAHCTVYSVVLAVMARSRVGFFERSELPITFR